MHHLHRRSFGQHNEAEHWMELDELKRELIEASKGNTLWAVPYTILLAINEFASIRSFMGGPAGGWIIKSGSQNESNIAVDQDELVPFSRTRNQKNMHAQLIDLTVHSVPYIFNSQIRLLHACNSLVLQILSDGPYISSIWSKKSHPT
jgi:hypothetical protein